MGEARREAGDRIAGFGHPVFTESDPRAALLESYCQRIAQLRKLTDREELAGAIEDAVWAHMRLPSNFDWPFGRLLEYLGFRPRSASGDLRLQPARRLVRPRHRAGVERRSHPPRGPATAAAEHLDFEPIWRRDACCGERRA